MTIIWNISGVSVQGTSHIDREVPCQDFFDYAVLDDGNIIIAVADGAGSAQQSQVGASLAVLSSIMYMREEIQKDFDKNETSFLELIRNTFLHALNMLQEYSQANGVELRQLATTLHIFGWINGWVCYGQVGDGAFVIKTQDDCYRLLVRPISGEYANETFFLTSNNALNYLQTYICQEQVLALAGMTDGMTNIALDLVQWTPFAPFLDAIFQKIQEYPDSEASQAFLTQFLQSDRVNQKTDDDKTFLLAIPRLKSLDA